MAAAVMGSIYSPPSPTGLMSDTTSPIYPDRPIRPLPKRRLRSRLSPETANSILYPTAPHVSKPLFYLPFSDSASASYADNGHSTAGEVQLASEKSRLQETRSGNKKDGYQFRGNDVDSDDDDGVGIIRRYQEQRQALGSTPRAFVNGSVRSEFSKHINPQISQSTASSIESVDGYDSFENTNNKKKRKIPTSGSLGNHHSTLSAEMAHMGISATRDNDAPQADLDGGIGQYYGTGNSAIPSTLASTAISGGVRGRYSRVGTRHASGRSPLGVSVNGSNALQTGRIAFQRRDYPPSASFGGKDTASTSDPGIISTAIANAAALPAKPSKGQENISLLEQKMSNKSSSTKTQFTFTCESDAAKGMVWPGQQLALPTNPYQPAAPTTVSTGPTAPNHRGFATHGTQTSPSMNGQPSHTASQPPGASQPNPPQARKSRRPPAKQYAAAARQRRIRQDYNNYHHPPGSEDIWICEFCEYESIFGSPPEALVRQYEIKDRRERRRAAEKRRLLEKAKMKGRKGKKGNKNAAKNVANATQAQQPTPKPRYEPKPVEHGAVQHQGTQSEEYLADDYDDDPIPMPALVPQSPPKVPQAAGQNHSQSQRSAIGSGVPSMGDTSSG